MEEVFDKSKEYELLVTQHDPVYRDLILSIDLVKKFIIDNGLIVYGGSALDYALRLKGDKIYPDDMLAVPDLDMYSPDCVSHAYQLADILYHKGYTEARAINAQHMETMRVDLVDNHFIADITYRPKKIFDTMPTLVYNGMKIIHPTFQRIDMHSSLSFPYDNVPREVVFDRWFKDVKRFNLLNKYYPIEPQGATITTRIQEFPLRILDYIPCGFYAYAIIYGHFLDLVNLAGGQIPPGIIAAHIKIGNTVCFPTLDNMVEFVHHSVDVFQQEWQLGNLRTYESYIHIVPERLEGTSEDAKICVYSTKNRLLSVNTLNGRPVVNIQYLLRMFLSMYFMHAPSKLANTYLAHYTSCLTMIEAAESMLVDIDGAQEIVMDSPLFLSTATYGTDNINLAREVALARLYTDIDGAPPPVVPNNYKPANSIDRPHPQFDYNTSVYFRELGREKVNT